MKIIMDDGEREVNSDFAPVTRLFLLQQMESQRLAGTLTVPSAPRIHGMVKRLADCSTMIHSFFYLFFPYQVGMIVSIPIQSLSLCSQRLSSRPLPGFVLRNW